MTRRITMPCCCRSFTKEKHQASQNYVSKATPGSTYCHCQNQANQWAAPLTGEGGLQPTSAAKAAVLSCPVLQRGSAVPSPRACGHPNIQQSPKSSEQRTKQHLVKCVLEQGGFLAEAEMEPGGSACSSQLLQRQCCSKTRVRLPGAQ